MMSWEISSSEDVLPPPPFDDEEEDDDELLHQCVLCWSLLFISAVPSDETVLQLLVLEEISSQFIEETAVEVF